MDKQLITNEELLKQIKQLQEQVEKMKTPVPYLVPYITPVPQHCSCHHCHPSITYIQPYTVNTPYIYMGGGGGGIGISGSLNPQTYT
jgi:hypothetical protein